MKAALYSLAALVSLFQASAWPKHTSTDHLKIEIARVELGGRISVRVSNPREESIRIWKEANSWGSAHWRVVVVRKGQLETFFQNPDQLFTKNVPDFDEIAGEKHIDRELDLNGGNWCGLGYCGDYNDQGFGGEKMRFQPNDTVVVIYDVPRSKESSKFDVWNGVVATMTIVR